MKLGVPEELSLTFCRHVRVHHPEIDRHDPVLREAVNPTVSSDDGGLALRRKSEISHPVQLPMRTPSFSPPYMRPRSPSPAELAPDAEAADSPSRFASSHAPFAAKSYESSVNPPTPASTPPTSGVSGGSSMETSSMDCTRPQNDEHNLPETSTKRPASPLERKQYTCEICGKTFGRRTLRENHLRTHTDERPFECCVDDCDERFKLRNEKVRHEQTKHQEKRFCCGGILDSGKFWGCGKKFARSDGLLEHQTKTKKGRGCLEERDP